MQKQKVDQIKKLTNGKIAVKWVNGDGNFHQINDDDISAYLIYMLVFDKKGKTDSSEMINDLLSN